MLYIYAILILIETSHNTLLTINEFGGSHTQYWERKPIIKLHTTNRMFVASVISVAFRMESGLIQNDTCLSESRASNVFMAKVIGVCWFAGRTWKNKKSCASPAGLCPWVGDTCHKRNCTLNRSLGTLQLSCSFCYWVITCAVQMWCGAACEGRKFPPVPVFPSLSA